MKNNRKLRAFSLIEVSIVVLIIGILIAGITQSSRLLAQAKVNTAKSLTQSSPAASIKGLSLWIESTLDSSFISTETDDGTAISEWRDYNPQVSTKADFVKGTTAPTYTLNAINGIPAVLFDGSAFMSATNFSDISTNQATVFIVVKLPSTLASEAIISKRGADASAGVNFQVSTNSTASTGWTYCDGEVQDAVTCELAASGAAVIATNSYIYSSVYTANSDVITTSTAGGINFFQNGAKLNQVATSGTSRTGPVSSGNKALHIGATSFTTPTNGFKGYIGEIIVYDRALKQEERQSIEGYLSKKWGIGVTVADI